MVDKLEEEDGMSVMTVDGVDWSTTQSWFVVKQTFMVHMFSQLKKATNQIMLYFCPTFSLSLAPHRVSTFGSTVPSVCIPS